MQEAVAVFPGEFKLGRQRKHGVVEVPQHSLHGGGVLVGVVNVVVQTDELPAGGKARVLASDINGKPHRDGRHLGFFLMSSSWPTACDTLVRTILKAMSSSPLISNLRNWSIL